MDAPRSIVFDGREADSMTYFACDPHTPVQAETRCA
jgi:hypothetical protein